MNKCKCNKHGNINPIRKTYCSVVALPKLRGLDEISLILVSTAFQTFLLKLLRRNRRRHKWDEKYLRKKIKTENVVEETENISLSSFCNLYQNSIIGIFYCSVVALSYLSFASHVFLILVSAVSQMFLPKSLGLGFTRICSHITPMQVVSMLNTMWETQSV